MSQQPKPEQDEAWEKKPYRFVSITRDDVPRQEPVGHAAYKPGLITGTLHGTLKASPLVHVSSGQIKLTGQSQPPLLKAHFQTRGQLAIPATSLKGVVRSIVEAISPSCVRVTTARANQYPEQASGCHDKEQLCVACRMFGALGYEGQVRFADALSQERRKAFVSIPRLYPPRPGARFYREDHHHSRWIAGRKFYRHGKPARGEVAVAVAPAHSEFSLRVDLENLTEAEFGLLLIALGQGQPRLYPKLGGGKPVCLGSVQVNLDNLALVDDMAAACMGYDVAYRVVKDWTGYIQAAYQAGLVLQDQLDKLAQILKYDPNYECPSEAY